RTRNTTFNRCSTAPARSFTRPTLSKVWRRDRSRLIRPLISPCSFTVPSLFARPMTSNLLPPAILGDAARCLDSVPTRRDKIRKRVRIQRLREVRVEARVLRPSDIVWSTVPSDRDQDNGITAGRGSHRLRDGVPVDVRKAEVNQNDLGP